MLADLLPESLPSVELEISLPAGWTCETEYAPDNGKYQVRQPEKTVLLIGRGLRREAHRVDGLPFDVALSEQWPFKSEVGKAATKVLEKYLALTGSAPAAKPVLLIAPLPVATGSVKWRAETRGRTVVLLLDPAAKIKNWTAQLGIIFTHELLHLWVPNSLLLEGDYDWFFEGFTLYTALVTALELKFIASSEYVRTLGRVYDSYLSRPDDLSLIDASERRWTSGNATVYDKGMLVAFLYDLAIRKNSAGKLWLGNIYKELFTRWAAQPANGNDVIIQLLSSTPAGAELAKSYIEGQGELDLKPLLADQKQLLKSLYYR
jgi:predicted metalloprotease with PDZ domain